jgi:tetratricopeptide (TPR) repeat protein
MSGHVPELTPASMDAVTLAPDQVPTVVPGFQPVPVSSSVAVGILTPPPDMNAETVLPDAKQTGDSLTSRETLYYDTTGLPASAGGVRQVRREQDKGGPLSVGQMFGPRYHIIRLLGEGGMGAVYQAWDAELSVAVALKVIRPEVTVDPIAAADLEKRFKNELLLARQVTHKNVVRIYDLGAIAGTKYITMSFVQGDNLSTVIKREGSLGVSRSLQLARQIVAGLQAAHEAAVVHRDLKPANIMVTADGQALIMDFGIARSTARPEAGAAAIVGTLEYMAPEQAKGAAVDQRADIYAFGLILYEMLVGRRTPSGPHSAFDDMTARFEKGLPRPRSIHPEIPEAVDGLVAKCLEADPAARYQTTAEVVAEIDRLDDQGEPLPVRRVVGLPVVAAGIALAVMLLGGTWWYASRLIPPAPHDPVSVVIADFQNLTNDPTFDGALEPMLKLALEGAGFISAYSRSEISRNLGVGTPDQLDEQAAREIAVNQGLGVVLSGSLNRRGNGYALSVRAAQAVTGEVITTAEDRASNKDRVLSVATKLATEVREALGDESTSDSAQRFAMETLSATSLDVVREYAGAMEAISRSRFDDALQGFSKAVALDPNFGLGYAGMASASRNLDRLQDAEKYITEAVRHLDGMTERERYRTRGLFYMVTGDNQACAKEFADLVARYAADAAARNNLAICATHLRDMPRAINEMREAVKILPKRALYRENLALYASYASDFRTGEQEARAIEPPGLFGLLALAFAQLGQGQLPQATETYQQLAKIDAQGASYTASGLGDVALYEGRFSDAVRILEPGAAADEASGDSYRAAAKFAALASARLSQAENAAAIAAAEQALAASQAVKIRFLVARVFVEAGDIARARPLAAGLASELPAQPQAYAKIVEGDAALKAGDPRQAIKLLTEANGILDTWIGRFDLGRAYLEAGAFTQADSEFDRCLTRRGEAMSLFLDEEPTFGYFPPVYYYQGRVREGLKSAGAAESYRAYLSIRGQSKEDPLLPEVRRRAGG